MPFNSPKEILKEVYSAAQTRSDSPLAKTIVLAFLAGGYVALGGFLAIVVGGGMPAIAEMNPGLQKFAMGAVFPLGLILCVIAGADLFTGNTAYFIPPVASGKLRISDLLKNWSVVYILNFLGSLFVAYVLAFKSGVIASDPWLNSLLIMAESKMDASFMIVFIKGIGANWLVALAVWSAFAAKDISGKILAIWFPVMAFVTMGFEHSVANMFFIPTAIFHGADISWWSFLIDNLLPATLGNIVGGGFFTGALYWFTYDS